MLDKGHHLGVSPLLKLGVGMVSQFGLDYMHLVCLGVVKRLFSYWRGPIGPKKVRLGRIDVSEISNRLDFLKHFVPFEFARKPRTLNDLPRWKATEFRQFLLYTGIVVLKDILPVPLYNHFIILNCAIRILTSSKLAKLFADYANDLLVLFVTESERFYGLDIMVYNLHALLHLAGDVKNLGPLDNFSCFPFENKLGELKKLIRKPQYPVQQLINRLAEMDQMSYSKPFQKFVFPILKSNTTQDLYLRTFYAKDNLKRSQPQNGFSQHLMETTVYCQKLANHF